MSERTKSRSPTSEVVSQPEGNHPCALQSCNLEISQGEFCVIVGPSGCGKRTLLRILAGLKTETSGSIRIDRADDSHPLTSMVFQEESIFPWMTVWQNVAYGLKNRGVPRVQRDEIVQFWIEKVGLSRFRDAYPPNSPVV